MLPLLTMLTMMGLIACQPIGPLPGGELEGDVQPPPVDWTTADAQEVVQLETRPGDPYSVNVWGIGSGPDYYIAAGAGADARWVGHIEADPDVRLKIGDDVYPLRAVRVEDPDEVARVLARYVEKYQYDPDEEDSDEAWLFRLEPRTSP